MIPEPAEIILGDTITWKRRNVQAMSENDDGVLEYTDIKASEGWTLKYTAVGKLGIFAITASADDENPDDFKFTAAAATTAAYVAGDYQWQIVATKTTTRYTIAEGWITLLDNISVRSALYDNRSHAKKMLDAIEATLEGKATNSTLSLLSYAIAGRRKDEQVEILLKMRARYKEEYESEQAMADIAAGRSSKRKILVRFK